MLAEEKDEFLEKFNQLIPSFIGGGHEKAAGLTLDYKDLELFLELLEKNSA